MRSNVLLFITIVSHSSAEIQHFRTENTRSDYNWGILTYIHTYMTLFKHGEPSVYIIMIISYLQIRTINISKGDSLPRTQAL